MANVYKKKEKKHKNPTTNGDVCRPVIFIYRSIITEAKFILFVSSKIASHNFASKSFPL